MVSDAESATLLYYDLMNKIQGLSLVELLIAIAIGALLLTGAASMMISNKRIYKEQNESGRMQENARFALDQLMQDIRMAGYIGCNNNPDGLNNIIAGLGTGTSGTVYNMTNFVEGSESTGAWQPSGNTDFTGTDRKSGTDGITLRYLASPEYTLTTPFMTTPASKIHIATSQNMPNGTAFAISDCNKTEVFKARTVTYNAGPPAELELGHGVHSTLGNTTANLSSVFTAENAETARVNQVVFKRYYVAGGDKRRPDGTQIDSLFITTDNDVGEELVEGVEDLQILYGEDTSNPRDDRPSRYVDANTVTNWDDVVSVRVELTLSPVDIDYASDNPLPNQVVSTTVGLRNTQRQ